MPDFEASLGDGVTIGTVTGRYYAMDRDNRWERVSKAYNMLVGKRAAGTSTSASKALSDYYDSPTNESSTGDEFVPPTSIVDETGQPVANIGNGDAVVFYNYRGDRPREITRAFIEDEFSEFERGEKLDLYYVAMTEWKKGLCENVIFLKPKKMSNILGNYLSSQGLTQYRCAETEKYPHVTFFFNGGSEEEFRNEKKTLGKETKRNKYSINI